MVLTLKLGTKSKQKSSPPAIPEGAYPAKPEMRLEIKGKTYRKYIHHGREIAVEVEAVHAAKGPYRAAHTPGKPDNEWEVRDDNGLLVQEVVGDCFETARRRCTWLAGKLNEAYAAGKRSGRG